VFSVAVGNSLFGVPLNPPTPSQDAATVALQFVVQLLDVVNSAGGQNLPA
jgi:hypothetical protein